MCSFYPAPLVSATLAHSLMPTSDGAGGCRPFVIECSVGDVKCLGYV